VGMMMLNVVPAEDIRLSSHFSTVDTFNIYSKDHHNTNLSFPSLFIHPASIISICLSAVIK
jgi:hypothetical protein